MVIRGTPKYVENYITVKDNYIIYKLSEQGVFPIYIDNNLAAWNSACLSRCSRGDRPLVERYLEPGGLFPTMHG